MPVWNGERFLRAAIDSILAQTWTAFELIIIDDGSTDRTPEILAEYAGLDSRIRVIRMEHAGIVLALNHGISEAKAEWIARMDCDDIAHEKRLEIQWKVIHENPGTVLCNTNIQLIGEPQLITPVGHFIRTRALLALRLCFQCQVIHPTVMFSKEAFIACGQYVADERHAEDYGLWGRLIRAGGVVGIPEPLLSFRVHSGSISKQQAEIQETLTQKIAVRHCMLFMGLDEGTAIRAYRALRGDLPSHAGSEWIWFLILCLPKLRWKSLELWAWVASRTMRIAARRISGIRGAKRMVSKQ